MDDETREHLENLHGSVNLLTENVRFMLAMDQRTLLILIRMAFVLESVADRTFDLAESPDEAEFRKIKEAIGEIRKYFEEQIEIMSGTREQAGDE